MSSEASTKRTYRQYSPKDKADALVVIEACRGNLAEASRLTGIPGPTMERWVQKAKDAHEAKSERDLKNLAAEQQLQAESKNALADDFEKIARQYIARALNPDAIAKTSGYYAVLSAKMATETMRLLRGQSTANVDLGRAVNEAAKVLAESANISLEVALERVKRVATVKYGRLMPAPEGLPAGPIGATAEVPVTQDAS